MAAGIGGGLVGPRGRGHFVAVEIDRVERLQHDAARDPVWDDIGSMNRMGIIGCRVRTVFLAGVLLMNAVTTDENALKGAQTG